MYYTVSFISRYNTCMDREKEFRKNNWMRKMIYYLLTVLVYGAIYVILAFALEAVNLLVTVPPYVKLVCYIIFFFVTRSLTIRIMNMKWISTIMLQL